MKFAACAACALSTLVLVACDPTTVPEGSPDDVARFTEALVRFRLDTNPDTDSTSQRMLESAEQFSERLYYDCQELAAHPTLLGSTVASRAALETCPDWDDTKLGPEDPADCEEALCMAVAAECVAERLFAISRQVDDYESSAYPDHEPSRGLHRVSVPPQTAAANATLVDVASTWAAQAIRVSGENLRNGLEVPARNGVVYAADCRPGSRNRRDLFHRRHTLSDVLGDRTVAPSWAEVFLSTFFSAADLQVTLTGAIEETFSAVAESEHSRNSSASVAARFAWVEGRTSRARAAHALIGGGREDGLFRVPEGYGSLGTLNSSEQRALSSIRVAGVNPSVLQLDPEAIVDAVVEAMRIQTGLDSADYGREDLLDSRGLTEADFLRAARWLDDATNVFGMNRTVLLPAEPPAAGEAPEIRFAATSTFEVVPPDLDLLAGARRGTTEPVTVPFATSRMLDSTYPLQHASASLDYAADVAGELAGVIDDVPADILDAMTEVLAAGASGTMSNRHGRLELCARGSAFPGDPLPGNPLPGFGVSYEARYAGLDDHVTMVAGLDGLRCALTGTIHGAACDVDDFRFGVEDSRPEQTAGVSSVRFWAETKSPGVVYALREQRDEDGRVVAYEPIAGGHFPVLSFFTTSGCVLIPVVPLVDGAAARLLRPNLTSLDRAATSCAGIPADQRLPLEDELSDDGDQFESSWRHFLNLAALAAQEADRLGEAVINNGLEIERRVELASADLESVCGSSIDIDFLDTAGGLGDSGRCVGAADGTVAQDGDRGYICQRGEMVPDALETVRVRAAAHDPEAMKLLECIGDDSVVRWASLGSRPLCLWEDESGAACVGAREAALSCPVVRGIGSNCDTQLAASMLRALPYAAGPLRAVEVDQNLGVFADTIRNVPLTPDDPSTNGSPPCEDLRVLRSLAPRADKEAARDRLLEDPWLTQRSISDEARRLAWEALPYDYGVVTRDGDRFLWTGDPVFADYRAGRWPCAVPLQADLVDAMGVPVRTCAGVSGTSTAGPLGCSYISDCSASGATGVAPLLERVRMNQRVGRSVMALRLITAEGFDGMYLPVNITQVDGDSVDEYRFVDGSDENSLFLPTGFTDATGTDLGSMSPLVIDGLRTTEVRARDTSVVHENKDREGAGYCIRMAPCDPGLDSCDIAEPTCASAVGGCATNNMGYLWTWLGQGAYDDPTTCTEACMRDNTCANCFRVFSPCFTGSIGAERQRRAPFLAMHFTGDDAEAPDDAIQRATLDVWAGIGPAAGADEVGVVRDAFDHFVGEGEAGAVVPDFDERRYLFRYWRDPSSIRLMEELTYGDVLDGLELACASARHDLEGAETATGVGGVSNDACSPGRLGGLEAGTDADIEQMEEHMRCSANLIEANAELLVVRNVPVDVVNSVKAEFGGATIPELAGSRGVLVGEITADIVQLRTYRLQLARVMRELASNVTTLRHDLQRTGIQRQQLRIQLTSAISDRITSCIAASSPTISSTGGSINPGAAFATCANASVQIGLAVQQTRNSLDLTNIDRAEAFDRFSLGFQTLGITLGEIEVALVAAGHRLQSRSAQLATGRQQAERALGQAMLFSGDGAGRQLRVNTLLRRRFTTSQDRYEAARGHAMRMAYLAKLALEQRLGVRLADLDNDLTLVDAPSSWESTLCTMTGIQFARIRDGNDPDLESYADQYIGDYVNRLSRTAESYRLDFPFHEGSDTAVISMRDVLLDVRDECPGGVDMPNMLASSGDLAAAAWTLGDTCAPVFVGVDEDGFDVEEVRNCVRLTHGADAPGASLDTPSLRSLGYAEPWRVRFGPGEPGMMSAPLSSARTSTRLSQVLTDVEPGTYMVSWFAHPVMGSPIAAEQAIEVRAGGAVQALAVEAEGVYGGVCDLAEHGGWCRYYAFVSVSSPSDVILAVAPNASDPATVDDGEITNPQAIDIAGIQFEDMTRVRRSSVEASTLRPTAFIRTDHNARSSIPVCEDTDGDVFRDGWRYECERLCAAGFRTDCPEESAVLACFWERSFEFASEDLLARGQLARAGFAVGNYNYRTDGLALNFVGTNVRDCEGSAFPSSCFGSGYVNYSIEHVGPYTVINHQGERYSAPLFTGLIEYARGLSSERYLTNPLSSADRSLIESYTRGEFRGRPLTGSYIVRIWDDGAVNFGAIEDVQILLNYRYWTRFR